MGKSNLTILSVLVALLFLNVNLSPLYGSGESNFSSPAATALLKVCGPATAISSGIPPICNDADIHVLIDEECVDLVPVTVYLTNIDDNPQYNVDYDLPAGTRPIHLLYEYSPGNWVVTDELVDVIYKGDANGIPVFGIDVNLPTEVTTDIGCPPDTYRVTMEDLKLRVVTPNLYAGGGPNYILYPLLDEANSTTGIFSCEIFMETHCACVGNGYCDPTSQDHMPIYDFVLCMECDCEEKGNGAGSAGNFSGLDNNSANEYFEISPNPFSDFVQIRIVAEKENSKFQVSMFDSMGKTVRNQQYDAKKGPNSFEINTSMLTQGVYYLVIDNGNHRTTEKLILMRH